MNAWESSRIGSLQLKNRFWRSASNERFGAEDGLITQRLIDIIEELAQNEVGCIITSHYAVAAGGRADERQPLVLQPGNGPLLEKMAAAAHRHGTPIIAQLSHAGPKTPDAFQPEALRGLEAGAWCAALREEDIDEIQKCFADAAAAVQQAGFDGVQVHCAHGYLYSTFFDPATNPRTDAHGGSVAGRTQAARDTVAAVKARCGGDFPVFAKLNGNSTGSGDYRDDLLETARLLVEAGVDCLEVSGFAFYEKDPRESLYFLEPARAVKEAVSVPVALVGGIYTREAVETVLQHLDYVSLSRPLICEPDLIPKLRAGQERALHPLQQMLHAAPDRQ